MVDLFAPDPFALISWRTNLLPADPARTIWLMCAMLDVVYGWPFLEVLEDYPLWGPRLMN